jgi:hypothetical protein
MGLCESQRVCRARAADVLLATFADICGPEYTIELSLSRSSSQMFVQKSLLSMPSDYEGVAVNVL